MQAIGENASVSFNGETVTIEPRALQYDDNAPVYAQYPITSVLGMEVTEPSRNGGLFALVVDLSDPELIAPPTIEYEAYAAKQFAKMIDYLDEVLRDLRRPFYPGGRPLYPGSYAFVRPPLTPPIPSSPTATAGATGEDLAGQIRNLAALRDANVLSPAEFAAAKARLLGMAGAEPTDAVG